MSKPIQSRPQIRRQYVKGLYKLRKALGVRQSCNSKPLFAYRSTKISNLYTVDDPVGPENDSHLKRLCSEAAEIICAWGNDGGYRGRDSEVMTYLKNPKCLVKLKSGRPGHPLYKSKALQPVVFN